MKITWKDRIRKAFSTRDEASLEEALAAEVMDEASEEPKAEEAEAKKEDEPTKDEEPLSLESLCARIDALEAKLAALSPSADEAPADEEKKDDEPTKDEEPAEEKKEEAKTADSAFTSDVFARAEILAPGIKLPTVDSLTTDSLCALKRAALAAAFASSQTHDAVSPLLTGVVIEKLPCDALHATFVGASEIIKRENNARPMFTRDAASVSQTANVLEEMNRRNKEFWSHQQH